jgi:16S rRNA (cytidine1402-2'-O)-methyltransferase
VMAALVSSGFNQDSFLFAGFPPRRAKARDEWLWRIAHESSSVVFFEAPHRIRETLTAAQAIFGNRPIMVARELTKVHETLVVGPTKDVVAEIGEPRGEYTVVVAATEDTPGETAELPQGRILLSEFGHITDYGAVTRREAIAQLASKYGKSHREIYDAIEKAKESAS